MRVRRGGWEFAVPGVCCSASQPRAGAAASAMRCIEGAGMFEGAHGRCRARLPRCANLDTDYRRPRCKQGAGTHAQCADDADAQWSCSDVWAAQCHVEAANRCRGRGCSPAPRSPEHGKPNPHQQRNPPYTRTHTLTQLLHVPGAGRGGSSSGHATQQDVALLMEAQQRQGLCARAVCAHAGFLPGPLQQALNAAALPHAV
eukprot:scaffold276953_cov15-Tisochrysis_lutea.AAC.1